MRQMIRAYPERKKQYEEMISTLKSPTLDGLPHNKSGGDVVGAKLVKVERSSVYKEYSAVHSALQICQASNPNLTEFVRLYYWDRRRLSLEDVADQLHYSPETIRKWNQRLIYTTAKYRGLLEEETLFGDDNESE